MGMQGRFNHTDWPSFCCVNFAATPKLGTVVFIVTGWKLYGTFNDGW